AGLGADCGAGTHDDASGLIVAGYADALDALRIGCRTPDGNVAGQIGRGEHAAIGAVVSAHIDVAQSYSIAGSVDEGSCAQRTRAGGIGGNVASHIDAARTGADEEHGAVSAGAGGYIYG